MAIRCGLNWIFDESPNARFSSRRRPHRLTFCSILPFPHFANSPSTLPFFTVKSICRDSTFRFVRINRPAISPKIRETSTPCSFNATVCVGRIPVLSSIFSRSSVGTVTDGARLFPIPLECDRREVSAADSAVAPLVVARVMSASRLWRHSKPDPEEKITPLSNAPWFRPVETNPEIAV